MRLARILTALSVFTAASSASAQPAGAPATPPDATAPKPVEKVEAKAEPPARPGDSSALQVPETPPAPGDAGAADGVKTPPPPLPRTFPDEASLALRDPATGEAVAGWHNFFFIRDPDGNVRVSPSGEFQLDFHAFAGPGVNGTPTVNGGTGLHPKFFVKKFRMGLHGEFLKRWTFAGAFDITQGISNASGTDETSAAPAGEDPTADTARYRSPQQLDAGIGLRDVWVNYSLCPCLNFQLGQFQPPVSLENRTSDAFVPLMERSMATRTFVVPGQRETGLQLWGDFGDDVVSYEVAVLGGDGQNRATVDVYPDVAGRVMVAPFKDIKALKLAKDIRFGVSARHGERDQEAVGYDVVPFSTSNGFVLWEPQYRDSAGRRVHVIPSGAQNTIGGEFYVPIGPVDIVGQAYYNVYNTREAIEGFQLTNTERLGTLDGVGLTTWLSFYPFGDERIGSAVGRQRPNKLNLKRKADLKRGLELNALFSAIISSYDGNARGGVDDDATPGSTGNPASNINLYQFAGNVSYYHTRSVRMSFNYGLYLAPDADSDANLAKVPGNLGDDADPEANILHEFGTRLQLTY